jgi:hypothetical protein
VLADVTASPSAPPAEGAPTLPTPRGPLSAAVRAALLGAAPTGELPAFAAAAVARLAADDGAVLTDDDVQLSLHMLQELHYRGYDGVDDELEWDAALVTARRTLERQLERALRAVTRAEVTAVLDGLAFPTADAAGDTGAVVRADDVCAALLEVAAADRGPGLAAYLDRRGTTDQVREFLVHRSVYHLKEADPHSWAIPRLSGRAKAALVEVQADEYGGGRPERMHSTLFGTSMRALGLDDAYGHYVDDVPALTLATVTAMSTFGLNRRLRGAVAGHLAAFEMTSSLPNRRYGNALRRLGAPPEALWFFDEHVEADAVHEQIAGRDLAGGLVEAEPQVLPDVVFGAVTCLELDARWGAHLLAAWHAGRTSLRQPPAAITRTRLAARESGR